jgi:hypothetical protein
MTDKEYALEMRRKWLALAPDFFYYITLIDMKAQVDEFNRWINATQFSNSRVTIETHRATNDVTFTFQHFILTVLLESNKEQVICFGDAFTARAYKLVMLPDETFVLQEHSASGNGPRVGRGSEAKEILRPLFDEARKSFGPA